MRGEPPLGDRAGPVKAGKPFSDRRAKLVVGIEHDRRRALPTPVSVHEQRDRHRRGDAPQAPVASITLKGVGDRDPMPYVRYATKRGR